MSESQNNPSTPSTTGDSPAANMRLPKELRRQQLILSALRVFSSQGYHITTMNHIASAADVTKPVLYQHFTSKRELYLAVLDEQITGLVQQIAAALHGTEVNRERVENALSAFLSLSATTRKGIALFLSPMFRAIWLLKNDWIRYTARLPLPLPGF